MTVIDSAFRFSSHDMVNEAVDMMPVLKKFGIAHAVAAPSDEYVAVYNREGNSLLREIAETQYDDYSYLAVCNPWYGTVGLDELETSFKRNASGLYLFPARQGFKITDTVILPLIELCAGYKKAVYVHCGTPVCAMPFQLAELALLFPQVSFVMGHAAWSDFWYDVIPAALKAHNILVETSCTTGGMVRAFIDSFGAERVLFGSGFPQSLPENEISKINRLNLPDDVLENVMSENAKRLWGIRL